MGGWGRRLALWAPPVLYLGLIFLLSNLSHPLGPIRLGHWDKLAHGTEYAILAGLLMRAVHGAKPGWRLGAAVAVAVGIAVLWGVSDEIHQAFVPHRDPSLFDLLADAVGAGLGASLVGLFYARRRLVGPDRP